MIPPPQPQPENNNWIIDESYLSTIVDVTSSISDENTLNENEIQWCQFSAPLEPATPQEHQEEEVCKKHQIELGIISPSPVSPPNQPLLPLQTRPPATMGFNQKIPGTLIPSSVLERKHLLPLGQKKVGRNDPCPCGSGRKWKRCHGRSEW